MKHMYYQPECLNCGLRTCKNCSLPVTKGRTLRHLLNDLVHKNKFKDNALLYLNKDDIKELVDNNKSDDDEVE